MAGGIKAKETNISYQEIAEPNKDCMENKPSFFSIINTVPSPAMISLNNLDMRIRSLLSLFLKNQMAPESKIITINPAENISSAKLSPNLIEIGRSRFCSRKVNKV